MFQQIAERALPASANFNTERSPGEERTEKMIDATAALALRKYATILESMTTPRNQIWHRVVAADESLREVRPVKLYMEQLTKLLFKYRYSPSANFTGQSGAVYLEGGAFGTASLFIDDEPGYGIRYRALPLAETYFSENHVGLIDTMYRKFRWSARNAVAKWKDRCPKEITEAVANSPDRMFNFVHCVKPNDEPDPANGVRRDMLFSSYTASESGKVIVQSGGYYSWPAPVFRDLTAAGEVYGRSPATWVLPDIRMLNEMNRTVIRQGQAAVEPALMTTEDGALEPFDLRPGKMNPGTLNDRGEPLVKAFDRQSKFDIGFELMQAKQQMINEAFFITLFQILVENPRMTATEVLERAQEKGMLLGPLSGRLTSEWLGPQVHREIDLHARAGRLPEMPDELIEAGGEYTLEYENPLARAQRAQEGVAILRTYESVLPLAEHDESVLDNFDLDETVRTLASINGMETKLLNDEDTITGIRERRAEQQQMMAAAGAAPGVGRAVKDVATAVNQ